MPRPYVNNLQSEATLGASLSAERTRLWWARVHCVLLLAVCLFTDYVYCSLRARARCLRFFGVICCL